MNNKNDYAKGYQAKKLGEKEVSIKQGWESKNLNNISTISTGKWDANHNTDNGRYRFYTCAYEYMYSDTFKYDDECLILPGNGVNVGQVFYYNGKFDAYQRTYVISDIVIYPRYLYYHLSAFWKQRNLNKQYGSATNYLKIGNFQNYEILYPSLTEQKQIVAKLDKCFTAIDKAHANTLKNLENAKSLFQSQLNDIFSQKGNGWIEKKLGDICQYDKNKNQSKDLPYVGLEHIESHSGKFIGSLDSNQVKSSTFRFNSKHVLYGRLRPYLNKVLIPNFEGHCSTEIFPILVSDEVMREYLFYWLISDRTVKKIDATWTGARMPRANMNEVINFILPIPPLSKQKQIVAKLDNLKEQTQSLETNYQGQLKSLEKLKKSILQKAFSGELH